MEDISHYTHRTLPCTYMAVNPGINFKARDFMATFDHLVILSQVQIKLNNVSKLTAIEDFLRDGCNGDGWGMIVFVRD